MPAATKQEINSAILDAISESGGVGLLVPKQVASPRVFLVSKAGESQSLWIYIWTLTPGGRPALSHEFRIQMTSVSSPLELNPSGLTVLLGYEPNLKMFAGFDLERHREFTQGSPSIQIDIRIVRQALQDGLTISHKSNDELTIGIRPDHFLLYCFNADELHQAGDDASTLSLLEKASRSELVAPIETASLTQERRRVVSEVSRYTRSAGFRARVLQAYSNRCAVTRAQLRLVDAAHIVPVELGSRSIDDVRNGIALSPTYHRAFDRALIFLDKDYNMRLNRDHAEGLHAIGLDGGLDAFKANLGKIHLPLDKRQWPDVELITLANEHRGIT